MNWGDIIFFLLTLASVFVLVVIVFVLKSEKKIEDKNTSEEKGQSVNPKD